jgi:hypothetical protein
MLYLFFHPEDVDISSVKSLDSLRSTLHYVRDDITYFITAAVRTNCVLNTVTGARLFTTGSVQENCAGASELRNPLLQAGSLRTLSRRDTRSPYIVSVVLRVNCLALPPQVRLIMPGYSPGFTVG